MAEVDKLLAEHLQPGGLLSSDKKRTVGKAELKLKAELLRELIRGTREEMIAEPTNNIMFILSHLEMDLAHLVNELRRLGADD